MRLAINIIYYPHPSGGISAERYCDGELHISQSTETVVVLCGKLVEVIYDDGGREVERISLDHL